MSGLVGVFLAGFRVGFRLGTGSGKSCFRFNGGTRVERIAKSRSL